MRVDQLKYDCQHIQGALRQLQHRRLDRYIGPDKDIFERKIVIIFIPTNLNSVLGAQKNRFIEAVLLSTCNICFGYMRFHYAFLSGGLQIQKNLHNRNLN